VLRRPISGRFRPTPPRRAGDMAVASRAGAAHDVQGAMMLRSAFPIGQPVSVHHGESDRFRRAATPRVDREGPLDGDWQAHRPLLDALGARACVHEAMSRQRPCDGPSDAIACPRTVTSGTAETQTCNRRSKGPRPRLSTHRPQAARRPSGRCCRHHGQNAHRLARRAATACRAPAAAAASSCARTLPAVAEQPQISALQPAGLGPQLPDGDCVGPSGLSPRYHSTRQIC
jgi:hypothetical protein